MKLTSPTVEHWTQKNPINHVARCARVCYKSEKDTGNEALCQRLIKSGHMSMFRHATIYFRFTKKQWDKWKFFFNPAYCTMANNHDDVYVSVNGQYYMERIRDVKVKNGIEVPAGFKSMQVSEQKVLDHEWARGIVRYTFCITTGIETSRETNRTSPNNIAEQSTRYVDLLKGGISYSRPAWYEGLPAWKRWVLRMEWRVNSLSYWLNRKWLGLKPEEARTILALTTETKVVYTYTVLEWLHILDLRLFGTTGKPHPNAKELAEMIELELRHKPIGSRAINKLLRRWGEYKVN